MRITRPCMCSHSSSGSPCFFSPDVSRSQLISPTCRVRRGVQTCNAVIALVALVPLRPAIPRAKVSLQLQRWLGIEAELSASLEVHHSRQLGHGYLVTSRVISITMV